MKDRNILMLDYSGEWGLSSYPNVFSGSGNFDQYLWNCIVITDWVFPLSAYTNRQDWISVGLSDVASDIAAHIVQKKELHGDDFYKFQQVMEDLPITAQYVDIFNDKYDMDLKAPIHRETYNSIQKSMMLIEPLFTQEGREYNLKSLFIQRKHVCINLQLNQGNVYQQKIKARLLVGKILEKLNEIVYEFHPVIVFEELDLLCPELKEDEYYSSAEWIKQYILKIGRRAGCMIIGITQDEKLCDYSVIKNYDFKITHRYTPSGWDRGVFIWAGHDYYDGKSTHCIPFIGLDPSSQYEHYPQLHQRFS